MKNLRSITVSSVTALALLAPAPAVAGSYTAPDPSGDVVIRDAHESPEPETVVPTRRDGDITSSTLTHARRRVIIKVRHAALPRRSGDHYLGTTIQLRTGRIQRYANVEYFALGDQTLAPRVSFLRGNGRPMRCRGKRLGIDFNAGTITVKVPRRCLGRPRWVRMRVLTTTANTLDPTDPFFWTYYRDDALSSGIEAPWAGTLGRRVYRG